MAQDVKKSIKPMVIRLRKQGFSYSQIQKEIYVPKATLSKWLKRIKLTEAQARVLKERQARAAKIGSEKKMLRTTQAIEEIKKQSAGEISKISKRELWLMGIVLYWRERLSNDNENDLRKGVRFTSSDPYLIKLFLKWLKDAGHIKDEEINFDIFAGDDKRDIIKEIVNYWSEITGLPKEIFLRFYFQKTRPRKRGVKKRRISEGARFGLLRIRVRASSMLARQITGWINGIIREIQ